MQKLSTEIARALRHHPEEYGIEQDKNGWFDLDELVKGLRKKDDFKDVEKEDIIKLVQSYDKRFKIKDNKIRAYYGHSIINNFKLKEVEPPEFLYHGTTEENFEKIKNEGLLAMKRQFVHLSTDPDSASEVGSRRTECPIILKIESREAFNLGIKFYKTNEKVFLAEKIPYKFIKKA